MKLTTTLIALTVAFAASAQDTLPNSSFERWTSHGTWESVDGWESTNDAAGGFVVTVTKSVDAVDGTYSCKMSNTDVLGTIVPGVITTGHITLDAQFNPTFSKGAPFSEKHDYFIGKYKFTPGANDTGMISILFTVWDNGAQTSIPVGDGYTDIIDSTSGWEEFSIPLSFYDPRDPDTVLIVISSSRVAPAAPATTVLYVDSLGFRDSIPGGFGDLPLTKAKVYPNPSRDEIHVVAPESAADIYVYDISGRLLGMAKLDEGEATLDVSNLSRGLYLYTIGKADGVMVSTGKFAVDR